MIRTVVFIIAFSLCASAVWAKDEKSIKKLRDALVALAPDVDPGEAEMLSVTAHTASRSLAREYGLVWCPAFQNVLIHMGKRQRGYCGHYTRDIGERLKELKLKTLVLHWGAAYAGTLDENNGLVQSSRVSSTPVKHRSEEHTSELQSHLNLVCRLLLEKKKIREYKTFTYE